jgi:glutathione peroxidase-family protein
MIFRIFGKEIVTICLIGLLAVVGFTGCSSEQSDPLPVIKGEITVSADVDTTGDYSGIGLFIGRPSASGERDTLFYSVTDSTGQHFGTPEIENSGLYPVFISRNNNLLGIFNVVLAAGDTVTISGQLPNISETATIESRENEVYEKYDRLQRGFQRVVNFVNTRGLSSDSVEAEIYKWSDLFWDLHQENPNTFAGLRSAAVSASILEGWDNDKMLARTDSLLAEYNELPAGLRRQLTQFYATRDSLESSLEFLDTVEQQYADDESRLEIKQERIKLLYDSSRTDMAGNLLDEFKQTYAQNESAMEWAERMGYDITTLAPGKPFPEFSLSSREDSTISSETLEGTPFMIEFTRLDNPLYQQQYDRVLAIQQIYSNYGLEVITVPIGANDVVFDAFFEERARLWRFADPDSFYADELIIKYNLNSYPTRFLVNADGNIVQRLVGTEFDGVIQGLQKTLTQQQTES